jgi:hypothetical protein
MYLALLLLQSRKHTRANPKQAEHQEKTGKLPILKQTVTSIESIYTQLQERVVNIAHKVFESENWNRLNSGQEAK